MQLGFALLISFWVLVVSKEYSVTLDPAEKFHVKWSFEDQSPTSYITFTITCKTTGWVGLGFSPNGGMTDSDIIMGWVTEDGTSHLLDMHATTNGAPTKDKSQDVELLSATELDGTTTIKFRRKLNTCDKEQDRLITSSTTRLIYAYEDSDPTDNDAPSNYHGATNRGAKSLYLLETKSTVQEPPSDALTFDLNITNYHVPAKDTTYYCSFYNSPALDKKHHIVSVETLVQPGNEALVHHIVLYGCSGVEKEHLRNNNKTEGECSTSEMPEFEMSCRNTIYAWAVGGGTYHYPEDAGFVLGDPDGSSPEYFLVEVHYDNPDLLDSWVDSSSLRITYTPTLRTHDVGTFSVGVVEGIVVPSRPDEFRVTSFCDSSCTNQWIPEEGVEVFSYMLHSHLLGVAIQVDWYRNGQHIGIFANDDSYDFNFQESRHFDTNKKLLPGDALKITCTYTDENRDTITYGGIASAQEMCITFLSYYPKQNMTSCSSIPMMTFHRDDPVYAALSLDASESGFAAFSEVVEWNEEKVRILQDAYDTSAQYNLCYKLGFSPYEINLQTFNVTDYPYVKEKDVDICEKLDDIKDKKDGNTASKVSEMYFISVLCFVAVCRFVLG